MARARSAAWRRGLSPASLLDETGHAAKWRRDTVSKVGRAYATYLNWLDTTGQLRTHELPEERITPVRLDRYCAYLADCVKPTTIRSQLTDLARALSVLAPRMEVSFIRRRIYCYPKRGDPLTKRARMQEQAALVQLGLDLMSTADSRPAPTFNDAIIYRDGLMIAVLACRVMRLRNLTSIELDQHLKEVDAGWSLGFAATETKNHRAWLNSWPEQLVPKLLRYIRIYRPRLMGKRYDGNHLWISSRGGPLTDNGIYYAVTTRTRAAFGKSVNPHLFRDCLATSLAVHDPGNVQLARHALGHTDYATTQEFYNQAQSIEASTNLNAAIERLRGRHQKKGGPSA